MQIAQFRLAFGAEAAFAGPAVEASAQGDAPRQARGRRYESLNLREPRCARFARTTSRYAYGFTYSGGGVATGSSKCSSSASRRFAIASARVLPWLATSTPRARATNHSPSRQTSASA